MKRPGIVAEYQLIFDAPGKSIYLWSSELLDIRWQFDTSCHTP